MSTEPQIEETQTQDLREVREFLGFEKEQAFDKVSISIA